MKLLQTEVVKLENIINAARAATIDRLIIESPKGKAQRKARGIDEKKTVVIISDFEIPDLNDKVLGLNRLNLLQDRINLVKDAPDFSIDLTTTSGPDISQVTLTGGKTKTTFKCASAEFIRGIPKGVNDTWKFTFDIPVATITHLSSAVNAMAAELMTITGKKSNVEVEIQDVNKDSFSTQLSDNLQKLDESDVNSFVFNYPIKTLLPLLKKHDSGDVITLVIGEKGILQLVIGGHTIMVLPSL